MTIDSLVCAIDVGTSAVRAALIDSAGHRVSQFRVERSSGFQGTQFDPYLLVEDLAECTRGLFANGPSQGPLAVAISGHVGVVLLDGSGKPVGAASGWADQRGVEEDGPWRKGSPLSALTGRPIPTGGAVPLLRWLQYASPDDHRRVRWVCSPKDYLNFVLTGELGTDLTSAAYTLGLDVRRLQWDNQMTRLSGLDTESFPPLRHSWESVGRVSASGHALTHIPVGTQVAMGGPDGSMGVFAILGDKSGAIADVAGTTDVIMRISTEYPSGDELGTLVSPYVLAASWSQGGPTGLTGGALAQWAMLLDLGSPGEAMNAFASEISAIPPGSDGLRLSPLMTGSRVPDWRADERGLVWGQDISHGRAHFLKAVQEAAAYVVRDTIDRLAGGSGPALPVLIAGGVTRSDVVTQLRADVLGRPVIAFAEPDVSLQGAAMVAHVVAGTYDSPVVAQREMIGPSRTLVPDDAHAQAYDGLFAEWSDFRSLAVNGSISGAASPT